MPPILEKSSLTPQELAEKTWDLYQTFGVPIEVSEDILAQKGLNLDQALLQELITKHQELSRDTSGTQFKSGLEGDSAKTRKLHTTTHILHQVLRSLFGGEVKQMGSAITSEKARFDFSYLDRFSDQDLENIRSKVQEIIDLKADMNRTEMPQSEAKKLGAIGLFGEKYADVVSVYTLQDKDGKIISREFCGGPHIENTSEIGKFVILKQKSVGTGVKRLEFDVVTDN
jgi:alanyl-tRNA synthetase